MTEPTPSEWGMARLYMRSAAWWIGAAKWAMENDQPERALNDLERARAALPPDELLEDS